MFNEEFQFNLILFSLLFIYLFVRETKFKFVLLFFGIKK